MRVASCAFWNQKVFQYILVGGFNPLEKYQSNWIISPKREEHKKSLKPPPSIITNKNPTRQNQKNPQPVLPPASKGPSSEICLR